MAILHTLYLPNNLVVEAYLDRPNESVHHSDSPGENSVVAGRSVDCSGCSFHHNENCHSTGRSTDRFARNGSSDHRLLAVVADVHNCRRIAENSLHYYIHCLRTHLRTLHLWSSRILHSAEVEMIGTAVGVAAGNPASAPLVFAL